MSKLLVVGCGLRPKPGAVNLDRVKLPGVDIVFDLNLIGKVSYGILSFPNEEFDRIEAEDVLEHVDDPIAVVQELGRVLKVGGELWIRGPDSRYPETGWADLTHKRLFSWRTFDGFDPDTWDGKTYGYYHGPIKFKVKSVVEKNHGLEFLLIRRSQEKS